MQRGCTQPEALEEDYSFHDTAPFDRPGFPKLHFVEHAYAGDSTNWWIPNRACSAAMLRSAGFHILSNPEPEVYVCDVGAQAVDLSLERSALGRLENTSPGARAAAGDRGQSEGPTHD
jgi:hypothetical protein